MASGGSAPVAFVEFRDSECAGSAMSQMQTTYLLSSDRGPIRIEYAKSKMAMIGGDQGGVLFREVNIILPLLFSCYKQHQRTNLE